MSTDVRADGRSYSRVDAEMLAKVVWGEARGGDATQQAAVVWCILNRVDSGGFPNLALMRISAWHKAQGDEVGWW